MDDERLQMSRQELGGESRREGIAVSQTCTSVGGFVTTIAAAAPFSIKIISQTV